VNFGYVRECVAASIYNPVKRQDSRNWFERCLIDAHDPVKTNTEYLGRAVAFPQLHLPKEAQQTSCRSGVPDGTAVAILNYLMQQIDRHLPQMHHVQPKREGPCKFMQVGSFFTSFGLFLPIAGFRVQDVGAHQSKIALDTARSPCLALEGIRPVLFEMLTHAPSDVCPDVSLPHMAKNAMMRLNTDTSF